ncbi:UNVERIFIED_CONTAM: hypothetical protein FKN15_074188 [Acipenser sinensis]
MNWIPYFYSILIYPSVSSQDHAILALLDVYACIICFVQGKGLFAKRTIRKGETIFVERPLVSAQFLWNALYKYRACDYCLRSLETAEENGRRLSGNPCLSLPHPEQCRVRRELHEACPQCQVMYCSSECRRAAQEQYHQALCLGPSREEPEHPLNKLQEAWRNMHYPPETSSIMLMARMVATVKQARDKGHWLSLFSQFCSRTANEEEEIAHKLLGEKFQGQLGVLKQLFTKALYDEHLRSWFTLEGFRSLFALVGTNGQGVGTSALRAGVQAHIPHVTDCWIIHREYCRLTYIAPHKHDVDIDLIAPHKNGIAIDLIAPHKNGIAIDLIAPHKNGIAIDLIAPHKNGIAIDLIAPHKNGIAIDLIAPHKNGIAIDLIAPHKNGVAIDFIAPHPVHVL